MILTGQVLSLLEKHPIASPTKVVFQQCHKPVEISPIGKSLRMVEMLWVFHTMLTQILVHLPWASILEYYAHVFSVTASQIVGFRCFPLLLLGYSRYSDCQSTNRIPRKY